MPLHGTPCPPEWPSFSCLRGLPVKLNGCQAMYAPCRELMKSAYELAMERLQKKDVDAGIEHTPLTEAQKAAIAEIRSFYESKLAEVQVLHEGKLREMFDPAEQETRMEEYRRDRERLTSERDAKIAKARQ